MKKIIPKRNYTIFYFKYESCKVTTKESELKMSCSASLAHNIWSQRSLEYIWEKVTLGGGVQSDWWSGEVSRTYSYADGERARFINGLRTRHFPGSNASHSLMNRYIHALWVKRQKSETIFDFLGQQAVPPKIFDDKWPSTRRKWESCQRNVVIDSFITRRLKEKFPPDRIADQTESPGQGRLYKSHLFSKSPSAPRLRLSFTSCLFIPAVFLLLTSFLSFRLHHFLLLDCVPHPDWFHLALVSPAVTWPHASPFPKLHFIGQLQANT